MVNRNIFIYRKVNIKIKAVNSQKQFKLEPQIEDDCIAPIFLYQMVWKVLGMTITYIQQQNRMTGAFEEHGITF